MASGRGDWRTAALASLRTSAPFGLAAAIAGWRLAASPGIEATSSLDWHRWLGTIAAVALVGCRAVNRRRLRAISGGVWVYRIALFWARRSWRSRLISAGYSCGGADFLRL